MNNDFNIKITSLSDNTDRIKTYIDNQGFPGKETGFLTLSPYYTHKDSGITDWTGFPASGKTYVVLDVLFNLSERHGYVNALYVPDLGSYEDIVGKLVKMYTGKNIHPKYGNRAEMKDVFDSIPFLSKHFLILERADVRKPISPVNLWEFVCDYRGADGAVINNLMIDSWKNLYHNIGNRREDQYLDYVLSYRNELAEKYNKHFHTIAHAVKTELEDTTDGSGRRKRRIPTAHDIKGGGAWFANGKNMITVDRPDFNSTGVDVYIFKTKPEDVGKSGAILGQIFLDPQRGRYYEMIDGQRHNPYENTKFTRLIQSKLPYKDDDIPF